jgi:glutamate synthase (NADPH/NADH) large chain
VNRPCRYYVTKSGRVIGGSEVGVLEIPEDEVVQKGRLLPGKMFLIDFDKGRLITDEEYKGELVAKRYQLLIVERRCCCMGCAPEEVLPEDLTGLASTLTR